MCRVDAVRPAIAVAAVDRRFVSPPTDHRVEQRDDSVVGGLRGAGAWPQDAAGACRSWHGTARRGGGALRTSIPGLLATAIRAVWSHLLVRPRERRGGRSGGSHTGGLGHDAS